MLSKSDVNDCMALAVAVFPQFPLERSMIEGYYELLRDLNCEKADLYEAVKEVLRTSAWFPTVALIREEVLRRPTYTAPYFNSLELENPKAIPMPERVKELRDFLRFGVKSPDAPDSDSVSVEKSSETVQG